MSALAPYFNGSWWVDLDPEDERHPLALFRTGYAAGTHLLQCVLTQSANFLQNISSQVGSGEFSLALATFRSASEEFVTGLDLTEFQWKLIWEFSLILLGNSVLACIAWRIYGPRIVQRFFSPGGHETFEALRLSMSELKLPTEHDFKFK